MSTSTELDARPIVGQLFPTEAGVKLAEVLLSRDQRMDETQVSLEECLPAQLIYGFFSAVLQHVHDCAPNRLAEARGIQWRTKWSFQLEIAKEAMRKFTPN